MVAPVVAAGLVQGGLQLGGGIVGSKKAKKAAKAQAALTSFQRQEEARQISEQNAYDLSLARAAAFASGVQVTPGGSTQQYLNRIRAEGTHEEQFQKEATRLELQAIKRGGSALGDTLMYEGIAGALMSGVQAYGAFQAAQVPKTDMTLGGVNVQGWAAAERSGR